MLGLVSPSAGIDQIAGVSVSAVRCGCGEPSTKVNSGHHDVIARIRIDRAYRLRVYSDVVLFGSVPASLGCSPMRLKAPIVFLRDSAFACESMCSRELLVVC